MTRIFHWFFRWKMDSMSGFDIRLVFTLPPRDSTLQYKRCVHLWNKFPCITTLIWTNQGKMQSISLIWMQSHFLSIIQQCLNFQSWLTSLFNLNKEENFKEKNVMFFVLDLWSKVTQFLAKWIEWHMAQSQKFWTFDLHLV